MGGVTPDVTIGHIVIVLLDLTRKRDELTILIFKERQAVSARSGSSSVNITLFSTLNCTTCCYFNQNGRFRVHW
jgi:hypothetical protein